MATFLLLDGYSLAFRAWFALQDAGLRTSSGQETQAVYGFVSMVTKLLDDFEPDGMAVAFDRVEPTFRDEIVADYKAGREKTPAPLTEQIGIIRRFVQALGVPGVDALGYEADDVLGTMARSLAGGGDDVVIVTGDRDAYQLVSDPHIKVLYNRRGVTDYALYDEAGIKERTGVEPAKYPLLAALRGDPSDNIAGVPGVGEKTAARLVNTYGDLDALFAHLDECTPKLRLALAEHESAVRRNLLLTPIVCDLELSVGRDDLIIDDVDLDELEQLFSFLEMRVPKERLLAVLGKLDRSPARTGPALQAELATRPVQVIANGAAFAAFCEDVAKKTGEIAIEPVYAGAAGRSAIEGIALLPIDLDEVSFLPGSLLADPEVKDAFVSLVTPDETEPRRIVAHRSKELMRSLLPLGIDIRGLLFDTAVAAYLVDPGFGQASLEELAANRGVAMSSSDHVSSSGQFDFSLTPEGDGEELTAAHRAEGVLAVAEKLGAELDAVGGRELFEEIERPLIRVLAKMEVAGIAVDVARLGAINSELTAEALRLEGVVHDLAGGPFNVNSPPQLRVVLYDKLGLRPQRRTKTGYSTDAQTLERLRDQHPIIEALLSYREVEKLRSTYGTGLLSEVAPDGRIHASFNQTVARTGRLSSDAPNLHNIPVRTDGGRRFREAFVPEPGSLLVVADYNQIELRVIAHLSADPGLTAAFDEGRDIHAATAAGIYGCAMGEVTSAQRAKAKMVSYGLAYGMEAYGLSQRLHVSVDEAAEILAQYFVAFPNVHAYMDETVAEARRRGYTETERGRRRYLPELTSDNFRLRQAAERQAMNAGIQGLAADIFKIALVRLDDALEVRRLAARIVLQVHDEVLLEVPHAELEVASALTLETMQSAYPLSVPLDVHLAWGPTWADAKQE